MTGHIDHRHGGKRCFLPVQRCDFYVQHARAEAAEAHAQAENEARQSLAIALRDRDARITRALAVPDCDCLWSIAARRALTEDVTTPLSVPDRDRCKYPGCADPLITGHRVTDCYFDNDPNDDTPWPMMHASETTGKIHIHRVHWRRLQEVPGP